LKESKNNLHLLYDSYKVGRCLAKMAIEINGLFLPRDKVVILTLLKGGFFVSSHLFPRLTLPEISYQGFIGVRSYAEGETQSGETANIYGELLLSKEQFRDAIVFILDDVIETGKTLGIIKKNIRENFEPKVVYTCALVDKRRSRMKDQEPDIVGLFYEGNRFLVGCGMDYNEKYRHLPYIGYLK
jgi:hypoxanthine phosphoribosyltransferase